MNRPQRNNNPFAIMDTTPDPWRGLVGHAADGFLQFDTPAHGARAGYINLVNAYLKRGLNTIEKIFPVYAPAGHGANVPEDYIRRVSSLTGIPRNKVISTKAEIYAIGKAIVTHEEGIFWMRYNDLNKGFEDAMKATSSFIETIVNNPRISGAVVMILFLILFYIG